MSAMRLAVMVVLAAALAGQASAAQAKVTPVEKVIKLMEKLLAESQEEGQAEAMAYDKFACFCKAQADEKLLTIAQAGEKDEILAARIEKYSTVINELNMDITDQQDQIKTITAKMKEEKEKRAKAFAEFVVQRDDYAEAIRGDTEAIQMMEGSTTKAIALMQVAPLREKINAALRSAVRHGGLQASSPAEADKITSMLEIVDSEDPAAYGFHSGEIVKTLRDVGKEFKAKKNEVEEVEATDKHDFDMAQNARAHQLKSAQDTKEKDESLVAENEEAKEADTAEKEQTKKDKEADQTFLDELVSQCEDTAKAWDQRSQTRAQELSALSEALEILKGKVAANYGANKKLNGLITVKSEVKKGGAKGHWEWVPDQVSFLQMGRKPSRATGEKKVLEYLQEQSNKLQSPNLATLVLRVKAMGGLKIKAGEDHFVKVRTMIKDMIAKLEAAAEAEQGQKEWCDESMAAAMTKRDDAVAGVEGAFASITENKATIANAKADIEARKAEIAELYKALNEATGLRAAEKEENAKTVKDAAAGGKAVDAAMQVLKDFYAPKLVQTSSRKYTPPKGDASGKTVGDLAPKTGFEDKGDYEGNKDAASGIIGLMEVISSDFKRTIEETESAEEKAETEYTDYKSGTETTIGEKKDAIKESKKTLADTEASLLDNQDELKEQSDTKKEALAELAKLKPACVSTGADYKERVARREQEIESLKNAYQILDTMS